MQFGLFLSSGFVPVHIYIYIYIPSQRSVNHRPDGRWTTAALPTQTRHKLQTATSAEWLWNEVQQIQRKHTPQALLHVVGTHCTSWLYRCISVKLSAVSSSSSKPTPLTSTAICINTEEKSKAGDSTEFLINWIVCYLLLISVCLHLWLIFRFVLSVQDASVQGSHTTQLQ